MVIQHTPGPWRLELIPDYGEDAIAVLFLHGPDIPLCLEEETDEAMPDARLIAAAPDMLAALKALMDWPISLTADEMEKRYADARAAIAKAEVA